VILTTLATVLVASSSVAHSLLGQLNSSTIAALITGALSPFAVDVLTKLHAAANIKRNVAFVLATLAGVLPTVAFDAHSGWGGYLVNVALAFVVQQSVHRTGVTAPLAQATADIGLGGNADGTATTDLVTPPPGNPGDVGDTTAATAPFA
jgi:hypothetical protein